MGSPRVTVEITGKSIGLSREIDKSKKEVTGLNRAITQLSNKQEAAQKKLRKGARAGRGGGPRAESMLGSVGAGFARSIGGSIFGVMSQGISDVRDFERGIARLAIAQGKSNGEMGAFRTQLTKISTEFGVDRNEVLAGASAYQALTGDTKGAAEGARLFTKVATATGATVADVATTAAALSENMKIDPKDFEAAFDVLNTQGKAGAIEIKDLAGELSGLTPQFSHFAGGKGIAGMTKLGAATQIVRRNFGSASEAATGMQALMGSFEKNASKLGSKNVFWTDKKGKKHLREFDQIVENISKSKLMKDPEKLGKALGSKEAANAFKALVDNFKDWKELEDGSLAKGSIQKDAQQYLESDAGKLDKAMNELKLSIAQAFSPEVVKAFASAVGTVADAVNGVIDAARGVADVVGDELYGPDFEGENGQVDRTRDARGYERVLKHARAGKFGSVGEREIGLLEAMAAGKTGMDLLPHMGGVDKNRLEQILGQGSVLNAREDKARMLAQGVRKGTTTAEFGDVFAAGKAVVGGSDATSANVQTAFEASRKASMTAGATADPTLGGAAAVFAAQEKAARIMARTLEASVKALTVEATLKIDGNAVAKASANASGHRQGQGH